MQAFSRSHYWAEGFICFTIWSKDNAANIIGIVDIWKWTIIDEMLIGSSRIQVNMQIKAQSFTDINANYHTIQQRRQRSASTPALGCSGLNSADLQNLIRLNETLSRGDQTVAKKHDHVMPSNKIIFEATGPNDHLSRRLKTLWLRSSWVKRSVLMDLTGSLAQHRITIRRFQWKSRDKSAWSG